MNDDSTTTDAPNPFVSSPVYALHSFLCEWQREQEHHHFNLETIRRLRDRSKDAFIRWMEMRAGGQIDAEAEAARCVMETAMAIWHQSVTSRVFTKVMLEENERPAPNDFLFQLIGEAEKAYPKVKSARRARKSKPSQS